MVVEVSLKLTSTSFLPSRAKHTAPPPSSAPPSVTPAAAIPPGKLLALQAETEGKDGTSTSSEGGSDDGGEFDAELARSRRARLTLPSLLFDAAPPSLLNGVSTSPPLPSGARSVAPLANGAPVPAWKTGVAAAGRDPKSRQRSRDYLKQFVSSLSVASKS